MASLIIHRLEYLDCEPWSDQEFLRLKSIIYNCGEALHNLLRDINHTVYFHRESGSVRRWSPDGALLTGHYLPRSLPVAGRFRASCRLNARS